VTLKAVCTWSYSTAVILAAALLGAAGQSTAHHAFSAAFDADQPIELKGIVTKVHWVNPHGWLYVDVKEPDGKVTNWGFEFGPPNVVTKIGIDKSDIAPGTDISIKGYRAKNGGLLGYAYTVTFADGRTFPIGGALDAPPVRTASN
jgi:hypothetical protein